MMAKMIENKEGEKFKNKAAMAKHEKSEPRKEAKREGDKPTMKSMPKAMQKQMKKK